MQASHGIIQTKEQDLPLAALVKNFASRKNTMGNLPRPLKIFIHHKCESKENRDSHKNQGQSFILQLNGSNSHGDGYTAHQKNNRI